MLQPEPVGLLGQSALSFYVFYLYHAAEDSPIPITLTRRCLGLQNKFSHFGLETLCVWALKKTPERVEREGERKKEKRDCSSGRVQIEFHINVCKFPRSC